MGISVDLAGKQTFSQNASTLGASPKLNCASTDTADFLPNVTKFQIDIDHVNICSCPNLEFHGSISYVSLNTALLAIRSNSLLLVTPYSW